MILCAGIEMGCGEDQHTLPALMVPIDLRMPNSEFDVLFDRASGCFVKILRKGEDYPEADGE